MTLFYEKHEARVTKNDDPEKRGRIKVSCVGLMGDDEEEMPMWVAPVPMWGWFIVPDIGEMVEIEVVSGDSQDEQPGQSAIDSLDPKWRSTKRHWGNEQAKDGVGKSPIPEDFTATNYGKRRGFATPAGHILLFDDTSGSRKITLTWHQDGKFTLIGMDEDGSIVMNTHVGHVCYFNTKDKELSIIDPNGNHYRSKDDTVSIMNKNACCIEIKGDNVQVLAQGACTVSAKNCSLLAGEVQLGQAATDFALLANLFMNTVFKLHTHPTAMGPSGPPIPTGGETACISQSIKVSP